MTKRGLSSLLHVFLVLAFITAGISPACKFISGQSNLIEICTSDGIKTVMVPGDQAPDSEDHKKSNDCAFCFTSTNIKTAKAATIEVIVFASAAQPILASRDASVQQETFSPYTSRAPPILL
jgi:hypothetical protein